jgi:hypothetical protein
MPTGLPITDLGLEKIAAAVALPVKHRNTKSYKTLWQKAEKERVEWSDVARTADIDRMDVERKFADLMRRYDVVREQLGTAIADRDRLALRFFLLAIGCGLWVAGSLVYIARLVWR